jgi:hypothetical protein
MAQAQGQMKRFGGSCLGGCERIESVAFQVSLGMFVPYYYCAWYWHFAVAQPIVLRYRTSLYHPLAVHDRLPPFVPRPCALDANPPKCVHSAAVVVKMVAWIVDAAVMLIPRLFL